MAPTLDLDVEVEVTGGANPTVCVPSLLIVKILMTNVMLVVNLKYRKETSTHKYTELINLAPRR